MGVMVYFHKRRKRFAVDKYQIVGLEEDAFGSIVLVRDPRERNKVIIHHVDESFDTAYNRINGLEPYEQGALVE